MPTAFSPYPLTQVSETPIPVTMSSTTAEKEDLAVVDDKTVQTKHVDVVSPQLEPATTGKGAVNALLILACIAFGSASFLFGYDDKVISPIAALSAFVRSLTLSG
jgi:hypothetical protein